MTKPTADAAIATPTKRFFVSMLTRDISLADAILDLVDNCLDGALRLANGGAVDYTKHTVRITILPDRFRIEDDCGGIPRIVAIKYAFKMGRETGDDRDSESETIGMYGVGMKRAIFKMGREAVVRTRYGDDTFEVPITSNWLDEAEWKPLPINEPEEASERLPSPGTVIEVRELDKGVARHFANPAFIEEVATAISQHFTMFLQRGLTIAINNVAVKPVHVGVLMSPKEDGPGPFVYQRLIDDVTVSITVGLNTTRQYDDDDDDDDDGNFSAQRDSATAGWTVLCNDRAVIVGDKGLLTGWGDGIPRFHDQYNVITGIIEFRSKRADKLPVTTTKRALDTSSNVWLESLVKMKEGMRVWISYTNDWKNHPRADQEVHWKDAKALSLNEVIEAVAARPSAKKGEAQDSSGEITQTVDFNPRKTNVLPKPPEKKPSSKKITYSRPAEEIRSVAKLLFDDPDARPGVVGDACFDIQLKRAKSNNRRD